jgi:predicted short-subunit dehydrogenase-like oxidoreductase (DUF2520 family)
MTLPEHRPARLDIGVVGAGRVGAVLGAALARAGHRIRAVSAVSDASRRRAADLLPAVPVVGVDEVLAQADLVLLTVPDQELPGLVVGLVSAGMVRAGQLLVHTSGRYGTEVLRPAAEVGAHVIALHPAMTFQGDLVDVARLAGAVFAVSADDDMRLVAEALVVEIGGEPIWVPDPLRPLYHAALAHASNHAVTLLADAADLLSAAGVGDPMRVLGPLVTASVDNALRRGDGALTGPVVRADAQTVAVHVAAIDQAAPDVGAVYRALAARTTDRALAMGRISAADAAEIRQALS